MLLLTSQSDQVFLATDAVCAIDVHASWLDYQGDQARADRQNTTITQVTTIVIVPAPLPSTQRNAKTIHVRNKGLSSVGVKVIHSDGTQDMELIRVLLLAGEKLAYVEGQGFRVYDVNGILK